MTRTVRGELPVGFRYTPGVGTTAFLEALRDRGVMLGSRCTACELTYLPARIFCERCFAELAADTECGPGGTVWSYTVARSGIDGEPLDPPRTLALVKLDGADTVLMHDLVDVETPSVDMRVSVRLREDRVGSMLDIEGFGPEEI